MDTVVLVMTCDNYSDTWKPFLKLKNKYWKGCPYDTYFCTETKTVPFNKTIKTQGSWTSRLRQSLEQLDSKYVILLLDDFFIRSKVDQDRIDSIIESYKPDTAVYNLERLYNIPKNKSYLNGFIERENKEPYLNSCQPSIHNRLKLIERLQDDQNAWEWEYTQVDSKDKFYINTEDLIFDIGYYEDKKPWGIVQGKWSRNAQELFKKENIEVDYTERDFYDIDLSIIIPYYKTYEDTKKLLDTLIKQVTNKVEIILVDDGCNEDWSNYDIRVFHKENGGVSSARNYALNRANGKYISFIDSDDMVSDDYVAKILEKIKENFDYCYLSWKSDKTTVIINDNPPSWNTSVWNCVYKKELIGNRRFDDTLQYGEDMDFNFRVIKGKKVNITDILYYYNAARENSLTDQFSKGMPKRKPLKAQIVMFLRFVSKIGGVETFLYEFFKEYHKTHDILFLYEESDPIQLQRFKKFVRCVTYYDQQVECETYLNVNCNKNIADNVIATSGEYYDMAHTDYSAMGWKYTVHPKTTKTIAVSEIVKQALLKQYPKLDVIAIPNLLNINIKKNNKQKGKLKLISTTRLSHEKGYWRMKEFAKRLNALNKPFEWDVYTNDLPDEEIPNFKFIKPKLDVVSETAKSSYLVQLSDTEADGYATKEAFNIGIPVISTNYPSVYEQGMKVGSNGYVLEMNMSNMDEVVEKMYSHYPNFEPIKFNYSERWVNILPRGKKSTYVHDEKEPIVEPIPDNWVAVMRMKDDEGKIIKTGETPVLKSTERIRRLLEFKIIKRKE